MASDRIFNIETSWENSQDFILADHNFVEVLLFPIYVMRDSKRRRSMARVALRTGIGIDVLITIRAVFAAFRLFLPSIWVDVWSSFFSVDTAIVRTILRTILILMHIIVPFFLRTVAVLRKFYLKVEGYQSN
jgi:hypothetical protein